MYTWYAWIRIFFGTSLAWGLTGCAVVQVSHYQAYDAHCQLYVQHEQLRLRELDSIDRYCLRHPGLGCPLLATTVGVLAAPTYVLGPLAAGLGNTHHWLTRRQQCRPIMPTPTPIPALTQPGPEEAVPPLLAAPEDFLQPGARSASSGKMQ